MQILGILTLAVAYFLKPHQLRDLNRYSFGKYLLHGHVHPRTLRVRMGHEKYESTEVNLRLFALDMVANYQIQFTLDITDALQQPRSGGRLEEIMMFDIDDTTPDTPAPRELNQDIQALINNGLDLLDKACEELEASKPKFSVVSLWTAVEILLRVPLAHEHWSLVCGPGKPIKGQAYLTGDFQLVTYEETREGLRNVLKRSLGRETDSTFDKIRKHRSRVVHFYHPTFTEAEQCRALKEQANVWFTLSRLLRDEWKIIFGVKHNWKLAFNGVRLTRGSKLYAEVRFKQVRPELGQLFERDIQAGNCNECHQHMAVTGTETTGDENREPEVARCKVHTGSVRQITLVCPDRGMPQLLPEGNNDFEREHYDCTSDRYKLLDEELSHSVDEQLLSVFPAGYTNCMTPESVYKFGNSYLYTQYFIYYTEPHVYGCCDHLSGSIPELSRIRGCEFHDGDQRYFNG